MSVSGNAATAAMIEHGIRQFDASQDVRELYAGAPESSYSIPSENMTLAIKDLRGATVACVVAYTKFPQPARSMSCGPDDNVESARQRLRQEFIIAKTENGNYYQVCVESDHTTDSGRLVGLRHIDVGLWR